MCELRVSGLTQRDHVTDRRDARNIRAVSGIDDDVTLVQTEADALGIKPRGHRPASGCHEKVVGLNLLRLAIGECRSRSTPSAVAVARVTLAPV